VALLQHQVQMEVLRYSLQLQQPEAVAAELVQDKPAGEVVVLEVVDQVLLVAQLAQAGKVLLVELDLMQPQIMEAVAEVVLAQQEAMEPQLLVAAEVLV
jgi:hypothetical protein